MEIIYCRGGDKQAPKLAAAAGMRYGVRYDYTAYGDVYMLDGGLNPRWAHYQKRAARLRPHFALTPDYMRPDVISLELYIRDISRFAVRVGVCPKFTGAVYQIPENCIICESIPSEYSGWLIPDDELLPNRDYHLLGGDPRLQKQEINRISAAGGCVVSVDGNKLAMKAAHGQVFSSSGAWLKHNGTNEQNAQLSAHELIHYFSL